MVRPLGFEPRTPGLRVRCSKPAELRADICDEFTYHHSYSHDNLPNFCGATVALARGRCPRAFAPLQLITAYSRPGLKDFSLSYKRPAVPFGFLQ